MPLSCSLLPRRGGIKESEKKKKVMGMCDLNHFTLKKVGYVIFHSLLPTNFASFPSLCLSGRNS